MGTQVMTVAHVLIYDSDGVRSVDQCEGASWTGGCPRSVPGSPVACAGRRIAVIDSAGTVLLELRVEPDAVSCPLVALQFVSKDFAEHSKISTPPSDEQEPP
jgi:hypothetical protein